MLQKSLLRDHHGWGGSTIQRVAQRPREEQNTAQVRKCCRDKQASRANRFAKTKEKKSVFISIWQVNKWHRQMELCGWTSSANKSPVLRRTHMKSQHLGQPALYSTNIQCTSYVPPLYVGRKITFTYLTYLFRLFPSPYYNAKRFSTPKAAF